MLIALLSATAGLYGLAVGGLYLAQDGMIFPRHGMGDPVDPLPPAAERLVHRADDGIELRGFHLPPTETDSGVTVLGFGGNRWDAQDFAVFVHEALPEAEVIVFYYRGYGASGGEPSEAALTNDALQLFDRVRAASPKRPVVAAGFSIGSGVAVQLAARRPLSGLLLVTPFDSLRAVAASRYPWAPVSALIRHPFDSDRLLPGIAAPVAVVSAAEDRIVPPERTDALLPSVPNLVHVDSIEGATHNSLYDQPDIGVRLQAALEAVLRASPETAAEGAAPNA